MSNSRGVAYSALAVLALAGCSAGLDTGPLQLGGEAGTLCVPASPDREIAIGEVVSMPGSDDAVIKRVSLVDASNLELVRAYFVPIHDDSSIGAAYLDETMPETWASREDAEGAQITEEAANLVLVVSREGAQAATAASVRVEYSVAGASFAATGSTRYVINDNCE